MKFEAVRAAALALPGTTEEPHHHYGSFRVGGRIYVTVPPGQTHLHVFLGEADRERALAVYPAWTEKLLWGGKVVGVRVTLAQAPAAAVRSMVRQAHAHRSAAAPARRARPRPRASADAASARSRAASLPPFTVLRIDHVVFRVRDVDASVAFYERVLGGTVERRRPDLGLVHVRVGASMVDLVALDGRLGRAGGAGPAADGRNVDHLCLRIDPFDEARIVEHLGRHGLAPRGPAGRNFGAEGEGPSLYLADPDGNVIELKGPATPAL